MWPGTERDTYLTNSIDYFPIVDALAESGPMGVEIEPVQHLRGIEISMVESGMTTSSSMQSYVLPWTPPRRHRMEASNPTATIASTESSSYNGKPLECTNYCASKQYLRYSPQITGSTCRRIGRSCRTEKKYLSLTAGPTASLLRKSRNN
jgi:hypothetical protein